MSTGDNLFGFDLLQKKSLVQYVATHGGGGGGGGSIVTLSDVTPGVIYPLQVGHILMTYTGTDGVFQWTNVDMGQVIQSNVDAGFQARQLPFIDSSSPTALQDLIAQMIAKGTMASS